MRKIKYKEQQKNKKLDAFIEEDNDEKEKDKDNKNSIY